MWMLKICYNKNHFSQYGDLSYERAHMQFKLSWWPTNSNYNWNYAREQYSPLNLDLDLITFLAFLITFIRKTFKLHKKIETAATQTRLSQCKNKPVHQRNYNENRTASASFIFNLTYMYTDIVCAFTSKQRRSRVEKKIYE